MFDHFQFPAMVCVPSVQLIFDSGTEILKNAVLHNQSITKKIIISEYKM